MPISIALFSNEMYYEISFPIKIKVMIAYHFVSNHNLTVEVSRYIETVPFESKW